MKYKNILSSVVYLSALLIASSSYSLLVYQYDFRHILIVFCASVTALVSWHLHWLDPCDSFSSRTVWLLYTRHVTCMLFGWYFTWKYHRTFRSKQAIKALQEKVLANIVKSNESCRFGLDHNFKKITNADDFRQLVPVCTYEECDPYFQAAFRGEKNVLFPGKVKCLFKTSGTTGKNKAFPIPQSDSTHTLHFPVMFYYNMQRLLRSIGKHFRLHRQAVVRVFPKDRFNEHGLPVGPGTKFIHQRGDFHAVPQAAYDSVHQEAEMMYIHALFCLWHENISSFDFFFPSSLSSFMATIENHWQQLLEDVHNGTLTLPQKSKNADTVSHNFEIYLFAKPLRAAQLRALFPKKQFSDFFSKTWPNVTHILLARSASFKATSEYLQKKYLGNLPIFCPCLVGSEGLQGINLNSSFSQPDRYWPALTLGFHEFVPLDDVGKDAGQPKLVHELETGVQYESVITTLAGVYRMRTGDVLEVESFDDCMPVISMSHRKAHCLTVHVEKMSEGLLLAALHNATEKLGKYLVEFTSTENVHFEAVQKEVYGTKYYVVFIELNESDTKLEDSEISIFDRELIQRHENYAEFRSDGFINEMKVVQIQSGGFQALKAFLMQANADVSAAQFKMPRILRDHNALRFLLKQKC